MYKIKQVVTLTEIFWSRDNKKKRLYGSKMNEHQVNITTQQKLSKSRNMGEK